MKKLKLVGVMACVIYAMAALPVMAQQTVTGHVFDAQTKQPVAGANVLYGNNRGTSTDANGDFSIPCTNSVRITISYIGYQSFNKSILNCSTRQEIAMIPLSYALQKITVQDQAYIDQPTSISTLGYADLNTGSGLRLKDAINTLPGVELQTRSPFGGQRITIRGYYPNAGNNANFNGLGYQLFLNEVPVTDAAGTTIMDDIDFSTLGSVEVIKGPSPLYGNEIAGTVRLYSQRPQQEGTALSEQIVAGSYGLFRDNTTLTAKDGNMDLRINYGHQSYDSFRPNDGSKKDYISVSGNYKVSEKESIRAYFSYNHSDEQLAGGIVGDDFYAHKAIANPDYVNNDGGVLIRSFRSGVTSYHDFNTHFGNKTTVFATGGTLNQNFAHGYTYLNSVNVGARTRFTYQQQLNKIGINGKLGAFIQRSSQSKDGVFIPPFVHPPFTPTTTPQIPSNTQNYALNYNLFSQWAFTLPRDFKISVGGILNFNEFGIQNRLLNGSQYSGSPTLSKSFDPTFSPSASVLKSFSGNNSVYASLTTGNTPPLLDNIIASDGSVNDQLKPEHAIQYEAGTKGQVLNNKLSYKLALFDLEIDDRLVTEHSNGVDFTTNVGKEHNKGIELTAGYMLIDDVDAPVSRLRLWGSYSYSHFTYDDFKVYEANTAGNDSTVADYSGNPVAGVAPNVLNIGLQLQTKPGFYLRTKYRYMDKNPFTFDNKSSLKAYNLLSGRVGYQKTWGPVDVNAFVGSNNITGTTYYNFVFVGASEGDLGDGYISPAPYKTTVYGGATLRYRF